MAILDDEMIKRNRLIEFLVESNKIENVIKNIEEHEIDAVNKFLSYEAIRIPELEEIVKAFEPDARLRSESGMDVIVGGHYSPPIGGGFIVEDLNEILDDAVCNEDPWEIHNRYETLHPFTDCNGRSGRLLWLWQMVNQHGYNLSLGFLRLFYYQTLDKNREGG